MSTDLRQSLPLPKTSLPVVIFGAGSIVTDAHLPAYARLGFSVAGIYDPDQAKAQAVAAKAGTRAFASVAEATALGLGAVYDLATPPADHAGLLEALPDGAVCIIQKPMGSDLAEADRIIRICRAKGLKAAVNFQLRFSPAILALKDAIAQGHLGQVVDVDGLLAVDTPWHLWAFLADLPRVELDLREVNRPGPSYTIDTLRRWRRRIGPEQPLAFLIGRDSLQTLPAWRDWDRLTEVAHLVVATRPGHEQPLPMALADWWSARQTDQPKLLQCAPSGRILTLTTPPWPISSSILRLALHTREPVADWLAPAVQDYIDHHGLYRPPETPANP